MTQSLGDLIARYRRAEGLSARELAERASLTRSVVANIENGRKTDITIREWLSLAQALRVPPTSLLADIEQPFSRNPYFPENLAVNSRNIDLIDWVAGVETAADGEPALARYNEELERLDAVVIPPGVVVSATYGPNGQHARALLAAARAVERASVRWLRCSHDVVVLLRSYGFAYDDADERAVVQAMEAGITDGVNAVARAAERLGDDAELFHDLVSEASRAIGVLRDTQAQLRRLGGDAEQDFNATMGPYRAMQFVRSQPHEALSNLTTGEVNMLRLSSPLGQDREEQLEALRARWRDRDEHASLALRYFPKPTTDG